MRWAEAKFPNWGGESGKLEWEAGCFNQRGQQAAVQGSSALMDPAEVAQNAEDRGGKQARACVRLVQRACDSCPYQEEGCGLGTDKERWSSLSCLTSPSNTAEPANCTGPGQLWTDTHTEERTHHTHTHHTHTLCPVTKAALAASAKHRDTREAEALHLHMGRNSKPLPSSPRRHWRDGGHASTST